MVIRLPSTYRAEPDDSCESEVQSHPQLHETRSQQRNRKHPNTSLCWVWLRHDTTPNSHLSEADFISVFPSLLKVCIQPLLLAQACRRESPVPTFTGRLPGLWEMPHWPCLYICARRHAAPGATFMILLPSGLAGLGDGT